MAENRVSSAKEWTSDGATARPSAPSGLRGWISILVTALALGLIGLWVGWWVSIVRRDTMAYGTPTWVPALPFLAGDFKTHIDHVARIRASGIDPYRKKDDFACTVHQYPPMIGRAFSWVVFFDVRTSIRVWIASLGLILTAGALASWRARRALRLAEIPPALVVAAVLFSTPALYAMERGQADPLILLPFIVSAWLLGRRGAWPEVAAGCLLGATAWLKFYPGVSMIALVVFGRRKAIMGFIAVASLIGIVDYDGAKRAIRNGSKVMVALKYDRPSFFQPWEHWLVSAWNSNDFVRGDITLRHVPGTVVELAMLVPLIVLVSRRVARSANPGPIVFPYLLWLTAATTFALPGSNDYNLAVLPMAALAVWDVRDSWRVQLSMALLLIWWQPFWLPVSGQVLLMIKFASLCAVGASLVARSTQVGEQGSTSTESNLFRPTFAGLRRPLRESVATGEPALD
jgi:hypothetical protein